MKEQEPLDAQQSHWEKMFTKNTEMFGTEPSYPARKAAELFKNEGKQKILELGGGQGRDTLFLARKGFDAHVLDYSVEGVDAIREKVDKVGFGATVLAFQHDVRRPLPFDDESFDACYSHMLYCMALTTSELEVLSKEVLRVLKPEGLNIYSVRNTTDVHYRIGINRGEDMWEVGGFIVHFFSKQKVEHLAKGYEIINVEEFDEKGISREDSTW